MTKYELQQYRHLREYPQENTQCLWMLFDYN